MVVRYFAFFWIAIISSVCIGLVCFSTVSANTRDSLLMLTSLGFLVYFCYAVYDSIITASALMNRHAELSELAYSEEMTTKHLTESTFMVLCEYLTLIFPFVIKYGIVLLGILSVIGCYID